MTFTLTGTLEDHAGRPHARIELTIQPNPNVNPDSAADVVYSQGWSGKTDESGKFTVQLATFPGLTYFIRSTPGSVLPARRFEAPADGETLDLADIVPIPAPSPMAEYVRGASAYEVAVAEGFEGTEAEWLDSLRGGGGEDGVTDHGALTGLGDDDHAQYALADGSRGAFASQAQGATADTAVQPGDLATVATSGSYTDLTDKPTIPSAPGDVGAQPAGDYAATTHDHDGVYVKPADLPAAPTWDTLAGKPAVIAAGTSATAARDAIGAGTSSLELGTGATTAAAGNHKHAAADVDSGTFALARIPTGTTGSTVALGNHSHTPGQVGAQPAATGTPDGTKFLRDDNSWAAVPGGGGGLSFPMPAVGRHILQYGVAAAGVADNGPNPASGIAEFAPLWIGTDITVDRLTCYVGTVSTTTGAVGRMGIYVLQDGVPTDLVLQTAPFPVDGSPGDRFVDITPAALPAGFYVTALIHNGEGVRWRRFSSAKPPLDLFGSTGNSGTEKMSIGLRKSGLDPVAGFPPSISASGVSYFLDEFVMIKVRRSA